MTRRPRFVWILTVALGLALACGPISTSGPGSSVTVESDTQYIPLVPNPLDVQITLDTSRAQTSMGLLSVQLAGGATFSMITPEGRMGMDANGTLVPAYDTPVTITPVSTIEGFPFSRGFLAAANLAPDGMILPVPTSLTLTIPGEYDPGELVGFAADSNGDNFHLYPVEIASGSSIPGLSPGGTIVTFDILHFSAYGVARATPQEIQDQHARVPEGETAQDEDIIADLLPASADTAEIDSQVIGIFSRQHDMEIQPAIDRVFATDDCNYVDVVAHQFITWHTRVKAVDLEYKFESEIARDTSVLLSRLVVCMKDVCALCMGNPPGNRQSVDSFLIHAFYAEQISKIAGLPSEEFRWRTLANKCAENAGRPLPHLGGDTGCGDDCSDSGPTLVPPACPQP